MGKVDIVKSSATAPKLGTSETKSLEDTTATHVFVHIQRPISGGGSIANIETRIDLDEILKGHPKGTIVGVDKLDLLGDFRMVLPQFTLVGPSSLPFKTSPRITKLQQPKASLDFTSLNHTVRA